MIRYVYVAGPLTCGDQIQNIKTAMDVAEKLIHEGYVPFVPHLNAFMHLVSPKHYEHWMRYDMAWLRKCDALIRLPGKSPGSDREMEFAKSRGIPVYYGLSDFLRTHGSSCGHLEGECSCAGATPSRLGPRSASAIRGVPAAKLDNQGDPG